MRIAVYHNLSSGGAKRSLMEAAKRLATRHHVDFFTLTSADQDFADLRSFGASHKVFEFNPLPLMSFPFGRFNQALRMLDLRRLKRLSRVIALDIEAGSYDIVIVHPCRFENSPSILYNLRNVPAVYYCHEPLRLMYEELPTRPYDNGNGRWRRALNRMDPLPGLYRSALKDGDLRNVRSSSGVLVNSEFVRAAVKRIYDVDPQVSYHGVDADRFRPLSGEKHPLLLSVGSLTRLKGFDFLVQAVSRLPSTSRPKLVIVSNFEKSKEREFLGQMARKLEVELEIICNVSDDNLIEMYNQASMVVCASVREPFGLVPLEAMACGIPVVAVREGGLQESVVHEHTGLLVERDPARFAEAIQLLLANPKLAREYGRNGREHVLQSWTWDKAVDVLEGYLAEYARTS